MNARTDARVRRRRRDTTSVECWFPTPPLPVRSPRGLRVFVGRFAHSAKEEETKQFPLGFPLRLGYRAEEAGGELDPPRPRPCPRPRPRPGPRASEWGMWSFAGATPTEHAGDPGAQRWKEEHEEVVHRPRPCPRPCARARMSGVGATSEQTAAQRPRSRHRHPAHPHRTPRADPDSYPASRNSAQAEQVERPRHRLWRPTDQGLTPVHFSAQLERFVCDRGCE